MSSEYIAIQLVPSDCSICPRGQDGAAIKHSNIVQPKEAALKNVQAIRVLAIDPPGKVQQQLVEDALQKLRVALAAVLRFVNEVNLVRGPCVDRRINVTECPFIC